MNRPPQHEATPAAWWVLLAALDGALGLEAECILSIHGQPADDEAWINCGSLPNSSR